MNRTVSEDNFSQNLDFRFSIYKSANLEIWTPSFQILYLHGNTSHRAGRRRKQLYEVKLVK